MNRRDFLGKQSLGLMKSIAGCPETMVLAACDVDRKKFARFKSPAEKANTEKLNGGNQKVDIYEDYRELMERRDIDAVVIATPDHWHAMIAIDAAKAGNMQRSWRNFRHAFEMVYNGYLGDIKEVNVSVGDPVMAWELPGAVLKMGTLSREVYR